MGSLLEAVESFKGKRIVVTGDTGFKGSWLSLWLHLAGAEVFGYALPAESEQSHFNQLTRNSFSSCSTITGSSLIRRPKNYLRHKYQWRRQLDGVS